MSHRITAVSALAAMLLIGCGAGEHRRQHAYREVPEYTIEQFLGSVSYFGASFSPDKSKLLVSSDATGVINAYAIPVDGGEPLALTESTTDSVIGLSYFPSDERFLYTADQGGNELNHVYVREVDGKVVDLTPGENLKAQFAGWAQDDRSFFVATNERDPRFFDLYEYSTDDYSRTMLFRNESGYQPAAVSPDKRFVALVKPNTTADSDVFVHDRKSGEDRCLTTHDGVESNAPATFSKDGNSLLITTDRDSEFQYLVSIDLETEERTVVDRADWDVLYANLSKNGKYLVVGINNDARTEVRLYDAATMERVELPTLGNAEVSSVSFSRDEKTMAFYATGSSQPRDLYVQQLPGGEPRRLTRSLNVEIDEGDLVEAEVVRFASYDGVEIPGVLYRPHTATAETPAPALVWVHGGPGGQSRVGYSGLIQYLVNHGYVVYAINNRGSSGYGKTFFQMDDRRHGEADLGDVVASKRMLIDTGYVDPERIGIIGGSYGGYMVLAALAFEPEEFAVGVDIFGVANWVRTLNSIPPWWESFKEALYTEMGDPATDNERLHRISPLFHADKIVKPLMVLQGANDPRVLQVESDEMVEAARANGATVEYIVFEDEGHGFRKKENQLKGYSRILEFLDLHLRGIGTEERPRAQEAA